MEFEDVIEAVHDACIVMIDGRRRCTLCNGAQLPFEAQYESHTQCDSYKRNVAEQIQQAAEYIFSLGVFFLDDEIYCVLCSQKLKLKELDSHVNFDYFHRERLNNQHASGYCWYSCDEDEDAEIFEPINKAGILIGKDEELKCFLCSHLPKLPGWSQYSSHINSAYHQDILEEQLLATVDYLFEPGLIFEDRKQFCCWCETEIPKSLNERKYHMESASHASNKIRHFSTY